MPNQIGMVGLGVMGYNLAQNIAEKGFSISGYDSNAAKVQKLQQEKSVKGFEAFSDLRQFVNSLSSPRLVMLLVPAEVVDQVIQALLPLLQPNDTIIDGGNSHFTDTDRRMNFLLNKQIYFLGVGISGGEKGARIGPSIMPGGDLKAYEKVKPIFEAVAAKVDGEPCVTYLGKGSAGHYVKMVHNGIEYGLMKLISDTYELMDRGFGIKDDELQSIYAHWSKTEVGGFLMEITADIFAQIDKETDLRLVDEILDIAEQKGTGMWTSQSALDLHVPVPNIDIAVSMRELSALKAQRLLVNRALTGPDVTIHENRAQFIQRLQKALYAGMIMTYAQGMSLLHTASKTYDYELNLEKVALIWRGGCIIRCVFLNNIFDAFKKDPHLPTLLLDSNIGKELSNSESDLRWIVSRAVDCGISAGGLCNAINYYDSYRAARLGANLIQAQRDYFGDHLYERVDETGLFHTEWGKK